VCEPNADEAGKLRSWEVGENTHLLSAGDWLTCSSYLGANLVKGGVRSHYVAPEILIASTGLRQENKLTGPRGDLPKRFSTLGVHLISLHPEYTV